jgi:hypothetical protein
MIPATSCSTSSRETSCSRRCRTTGSSTYRYSPGTSFYCRPACRIPRGARTAASASWSSVGADELDGFSWYCEHCGHCLHTTWLPVADIETELPGIFARFYADPTLRTCRVCGAVMQPPTHAARSSVMNE